MSERRSESGFAVGAARLLSQAVAAEKGVKARTTALISGLYKDVQKTGENGPMAGLDRRYQPRYEEGVAFPEEHRRVQFSADAKFVEYVTALRDMVDLTSVKDMSNTRARGTVRVGDQVLVADAPPTLLLSLEKYLVDLRTFVHALPTLDPAQEWTWNPEAGAYASRPVGSVKTEKISIPLVLVPASGPHPAQVQMVTKDEVVGTWTSTKFSGYLTGDRAKELSDRVERLLLAVRFAREEANAMTVTEEVRVGSAVASYLLG